MNTMLVPNRVTEHQRDERTISPREQRGNELAWDRCQTVLWSDLPEFDGSPWSLVYLDDVLNTTIALYRATHTINEGN